MKNIYWSFILPLCLDFAACAHKPTRVFERNTSVIGPAKRDGQPLLVIKPTTVVLDVRDRLSFSTGHIPGAINLQWRDFARSGKARQSPGLGLLDERPDALARRLALYGIGPRSEVVVVGSGPSGSGEEGQVAWLLTYLGLNKVGCAGLDYFASQLTTDDSKLAPNQPPWNPELRPSLWVEREELSGALLPQPLAMAQSKNGGALAQQAIIIIDVRSEKEYLGLSREKSRYQLSSNNLINIEWREFFTSEGRVNPIVISQLAQVGITPDKRILVVDNDGLRASAATFALYSLGFLRAGSYAAGLAEYFKSPAQ